MTTIFTTFPWNIAENPAVLAAACMVAFVIAKMLVLPYRAVQDYRFRAKWNKGRADNFEAWRREHPGGLDYCDPESGAPPQPMPDSWLARAAFRNAASEVYWCAAVMATAWMMYTYLPHTSSTVAMVWVPSIAIYCGVTALLIIQQLKKVPPEEARKIKTAMKKPWYIFDNFIAGPVLSPGMIVGVVAGVIACVAFRALGLMIEIVYEPVAGAVERGACYLDEALWLISQWASALWHLLVRMPLRKLRELRHRFFCALFSWATGVELRPEQRWP